MDTWKHRHMSAPRRDRVSPRREISQGFPDWISRIPRIPPDVRKDESNRFMYAAERRPPAPFEAQSYAQKLRQHEYKDRPRSPYAMERHPYLR